MPHVSVYVTCPNAALARQLAHLALESRLAACANMLPVTSLYHWDGEIQEASEVVMFLKTRAEHVEALTRILKDAHSDDVPCIVALPIVAGHAAYLAWLDAETAPPS